VNRADFIPDVVWTRRDDGWAVPINRTQDPERWQDLVSSNDGVITQVDDGHLQEGKGVVPTSSSSALDTMAHMLELLDAHAGMNVLEVGAGTGYNAALIAQQVAPGRVTTVEIDEEVAEHARGALGRTGLPVTVIAGDGTFGHPGGAPYDRVMCTASAFRVPYAWVEQCRPGGKIVLPLVGTFRRGVFLRLTVNDDGTASGRFHGAASFMRLRNQRDPVSDAKLWNLDNVKIETTDAYHPEPFDELDAAIAMSSRLQGWATGFRPEDSGLILRMSHYPSGSWATVFPAPDGPHRVAYEGPRRLWEDLDVAWRWWLDAGRPDHTRFGLAVTPLGQTFWLDDPGNTLASIGEPAA
jgi:protein-L-isoaspartate(D-aspartate) O-methyltransferase